MVKGYGYKGIKAGDTQFSIYKQLTIDLKTKWRNLN